MANLHAEVGALRMVVPAFDRNADELERILRGHTHNAKHAAHLQLMVAEFRRAARLGRLLERRHLKEIKDDSQAEVIV